MTKEQTTMRKHKIILLVLIFAMNLNAQIGTIYSAVNSIKENVSRNKQKNEISKSLKRIYLYNDSITILRINENKITSPAKNFIIQVQRRLDLSYKKYLSGQKTDLDGIDNFIGLIKGYDSNWSTNYYQTEYSKYNEFNKSITVKQLKEKKSQDSIRHSVYLKENRKNDSLILAANKSQLAADSLKKLTPEYKRSMLEAQMKVTSKSLCWHDMLTIFTSDLDLNFSHMRLCDFLSQQMGMFEKSNDFIDGYIISKQSESISQGTPKTLTIKYKVHSKDQLFFIDKAIITGSYSKIIELFISYWPTKLQEGNIKRNEWAYCYMLPDRIGLFVDSNENAKIEITNNNKAL